MKSILITPSNPQFSPSSSSVRSDRAHTFYYIAFAVSVSRNGRFPDDSTLMNVFGVEIEGIALSSAFYHVYLLGMAFRTSNLRHHSVLGRL